MKISLIKNIRVLYFRR